MRVLVTGSSGFIGTAIVKGLLDDRHQVSANDLLVGNLSLDVIRLQADYRDLIPSVAAGEYDVVVHQGAITTTLVEESLYLRDVNAYGVGNLAQACVAGSARLVFASSASVYGRISKGHVVEVGDEDETKFCSGPLNPYASSKLLAESQILNCGGGLHATVFRYSNVFGENERSKGKMACIFTQLAQQATESKTVRLYRDTLLSSRDYVPVSRVVAAVKAAVRHPTERAAGTFNLGSGVSITFAEIIEWIATSLIGNDDLRVDLIVNPVASRYQHRTAMSVGALEDVFDLGPMSKDDVWAEAARIFGKLADGKTSL